MIIPPLQRTVCKFKNIFFSFSRLFSIKYNCKFIFARGSFLTERITKSPISIHKFFGVWSSRLRGCQWGIAVVSKQLKKCFLVSKQLKNRYSVSKQRKKKNVWSINLHNIFPQTFMAVSSVVFYKSLILNTPKIEFYPTFQFAIFLNTISKQAEYQFFTRGHTNPA